MLFSYNICLKEYQQCLFWNPLAVQCFTARDNFFTLSVICYIYILCLLILLTTSSGFGDSILFEIKAHIITLFGRLVCWRTAIIIIRTSGQWKTSRNAINLDHHHEITWLHFLTFYSYNDLHHNTSTSFAAGAPVHQLPSLQSLDASYFIKA